MEFTPEIAPLLPRSRYALRAAFVLPALFDRLRAAGQRIDVEVEIEIWQNTIPFPVTTVTAFPDARGDRQYIIEINPLLHKAGVPLDTDGFLVIRTRATSSGALPPVLKIIGFWVSYRNGDVYAVLPSNVQYNSSRVDYGRASEARLLDYFGRVRLTPKVDTSISMINPFPVASNVRLVLVSASGTAEETNFVLAPHETRWIRLAELLPPSEQESFDGTVRIVSSHRILWFVWFRDAERDLFYSADHAIPWINRQL